MDWKKIFVLLSILVTTNGKKHEKISPGKQPLGHMLPFGQHCSAQIIEEESPAISPKRFYERFMTLRKPAVFRRAVSESEAIKKWTKGYLQYYYGQLELRVISKVGDKWISPLGSVHLGKDRLSYFLNVYKLLNRSVISDLPYPLWHEVFVPSFLTCGGVKDRLVETHIAISSVNFSTPLTKDSLNQLMCVYNGTYNVKLIEANQSKNLYSRRDKAHGTKSVSKIDTDSVNLRKYPRISKVTYASSTLHAGDCIFIPQGSYVHYRAKRNENIAISILISRLHPRKDLRFESCADDTWTSGPVKLSKLDVHWNYAGFGDLYYGGKDLMELKNRLSIILFTRSGKFTTKRLREILDTNYDEFGEGIGRVYQNTNAHHAMIEPAFNVILDVLKSGPSNRSITKKIVESLTRAELRLIAQAMYPTAAANTKFYEYNYINPEQIKELIYNLLKKTKNNVGKGVFINAYVENLGGSPEIAEKIFNGLVSDKSETSFRKDAVQTRFRKAVHDFIKFQHGEMFHDEGQFHRNEPIPAEMSKSSTAPERKQHEKQMKESIPSDDAQLQEELQGDYSNGVLPDDQFLDDGDDENVVDTDTDYGDSPDDELLDPEFSYQPDEFNEYGETDHDQMHWSHLNEEL